MVNNLGARIKELRAAKSLSQAELANKLGVMQHTVSKYENNVKRPSFEVLILLADVFDVSTDYLLGRTEF